MSTGQHGMLSLLSGFINAHTHSSSAPHKGLIRSRPFEVWSAERAARRNVGLLPEELAACALVTGMENAAAGSTGVVDHINVPQTKEHVYAIARAYEQVGIRAWVMVNTGDLDGPYYATEYPSDPKAGSSGRESSVSSAEQQLSAVEDIIRGWEGTRVAIGIAIGNPVSCSDELLAGAAGLSTDLGVPITVHAEESPLQREVSFRKWGVSSIGRLAQFGVLCPRALVAHAVQIDDADVRLLADHGASVSHNPISNLKLQNGVAPVGKMVAAGINVCLGTDSSACADDQSLFPVLRFTAALARLNGLDQLGGVVEDHVLKMATENGYKLWFSDEPAKDYMQLSTEVGPYAPVWCDLASKIAEVYVGDAPVLVRAREALEAAKAEATIARLAAFALAQDRLDLAEQFAAVAAHYAIAR